MSYTPLNVNPGDVIRASDINAMSAQVATNEETANSKYSKPSSGIPKADLATAVQTSLERADSSVQTEEDPVFSASPAHDIESTDISNWDGKYTKPSSGIPKTDLATEVQTSLGKADASLEKPSTTGTEGQVLSLDAQSKPKWTDPPKNRSPRNFAYEGKDLLSVFTDEDALGTAVQAANWDNVDVGDYLDYRITGTYHDFGNWGVPSGVTYYSDKACTVEVGTTSQAYTAEANNDDAIFDNVPVKISGTVYYVKAESCTYQCFRGSKYYSDTTLTTEVGTTTQAYPATMNSIFDYCSIVIDGITYYVNSSDCSSYVEKTFNNAELIFEAMPDHYWRYGDSGDIANSKHHILFAARDGIATLKMRKGNYVWERSHFEKFTADSTTPTVTLKGTPGSLGNVYVNGTKKTFNTHYTISGAVITFKSAASISVGAEIVVEWMDAKSPWTGSALYWTMNDPDYGIINLLSAHTKLYSHIYKSTTGKGMRQVLETRPKSSGTVGAGWDDKGVLFLPTEMEIWGFGTYAPLNQYSNNLQWPIFAGGRRHISKASSSGGSRSGWWTCSSTSAGGFAYVSYYGYPSSLNAGYAFACVPCFLFT